MLVTTLGSFVVTSLPSRTTYGALLLNDTIELKRPTNPHAEPDFGIGYTPTPRPWHRVAEDPSTLTLSLLVWDTDSENLENRIGGIVSQLYSGNWVALRNQTTRRQLYVTGSSNYTVEPLRVSGTKHFAKLTLECLSRLDYWESYDWVNYWVRSTDLDQTVNIAGDVFPEQLCYTIQAFGTLDGYIKLTGAGGVTAWTHFLRQSSLTRTTDASTQYRRLFVTPGMHVASALNHFDMGGDANKDSYPTSGYNPPIPYGTTNQEGMRSLRQGNPASVPLKVDGTVTLTRRYTYYHTMMHYKPSYFAPVEGGYR